MQKMQEMQVGSLGLEDPLEKGMAISSSILAGRIPWTEEPGGLQSMGVAKSQTQLSNSHTTHSNIVSFGHLCFARTLSILSKFSNVLSNRSCSAAY